MSIPTTPSAQAPIAVGAAGTLSPEWFRFFLALIAALSAVEARVAALENAP